MSRWLGTFLAGAVVTAACLSAPPPALGQEAPALVEKGRALLQKGDWPGARDAFLAAVKKDGKSLEARRGAAEALLGLGQASPAIEHAEAGLTICEDRDAGLWLLLARGYLRRGEGHPADKAEEIKSDLDDARAKASEALKRDPGLALARVVFSRACRLSGDSVSATAVLEEGLAKAPADFDLQFEMGMVLLKKTLYDDALRAFSAAAAADPKSGEAQFQRGVALAFLKRWDEAIEAMAKAAVLDPANRRALKNLGTWAKDKSIPHLRTIVKEKPDHAWAHAYLAYYLAYGKDEAGALKESKAAMGLAPEDAELIGWHGQIVDVLGRKEEALAWHRKALQKNAACELSWKALYEFALHPKSTGKMDDRKEMMEFLVKTRPDDAMLWNNIGLFYRDTARDPRKSLDAYLKAAEGAPNDQGIQNDTGLIYLYHGKSIGVDRTLALPYFQRCLALVREENQDPEMGYRDTLENLAVYYKEVEKNPEKCLEYATERNDAEFLARLGKDLGQVSGPAAAAASWARGELKK
jgi:tetratricopeptide (TPR) repeat protein